MFTDNIYLSDVQTFRTGIIIGMGLLILGIIMTYTMIKLLKGGK
mgnify:CR=1 FL=1